MKPKKKYSIEQAKLKIEGFCAYQERCQQEVKNKLYSWGLYKTEVELLIADLIQNNFLNEERFARAFVSGKFNIKNWGRKKIIVKLKEKGISSYCINLGLQEIKETEYIEKIKHLINKKKELLKGVDKYMANKKIVNYLYGKGYESNLIWEQLKNIN